MEDGLEIWRSGQHSGRGSIRPEAPAIVLHYPKYPHNVGQIVRLASCFGISQVWYSGNRVQLEGQERLPREERMRGYQDVTLINHPDPLGRLLETNPGAVPVAIEVRPNSELLPDFEHPTGVHFKHPIYVFGPEDGSLPGPILKRCHRFVFIPAYQCFNLSTAVGMVLYDRMSKSGHYPEIHDRGIAA